MPATQETSQSRADLCQTEAGLCLRVSGNWRVTERNPAWESPKAGVRPAAGGELAINLEGLENWDSSLLLHLHAARTWCEKTGLRFREEDLPGNMRPLLALLVNSVPASVPKDRSLRVLTFVGLASQDLWRQAQAIFQFIGECSLSAGRVGRNLKSFRWRDCLAQMQECGAMALPIVGLVSFLVGVTLAYTGAVVLRLFGGDIWVADMIGLSVTREMAAVMTGVVLAGRTGAAFAAQIANMKANEEIDALATLGVPAVDFLVLPRMLALAIMTPLLALYANLLGILGGMLIALGLLSIPPTAYWVEMLSIVDLSDICTGLVKASAFGMIVGLAGCMRGLQAERSAEGVGKAATSAVVTAVLLMVVADALFAVLFNMLGW